MNSQVWVAAKRALLPGPKSSGLIKGDASLEAADDLAPGYSASGQDVWLPRLAAHGSGPGLVLSAVGARCGKVFLADAPIWGTVANTSAWRIAADWDPKYCHYLFNREDFWLKGGSAQPYVQVEPSLAQKVVRPPLALQREMAAFLDRETGQIDELIAKQSQLIVTLAERRQAVIDRFTWEGIQPTVVGPTGVEPAPEAPIEWSRVRNKQVFRERVELSQTGEEELLTVSHLTGVTPRSEKNVNMIEAVSLEGYKIVNPGDLVINTLWGWMGALGVSKVHGIVSPAYGVYAPQDGGGSDSRYFDYLYRSRPYVCEITRHSKGVWSSRLRLYPQSFLSMSVVVPPLKEQCEIADRIDLECRKIDKLSAKGVQMIVLLRERRHALISAVVTSKIDVTTMERVI